MADREARQSEAWQEKFQPGLGCPWPNSHDLLTLVQIGSTGMWEWKCRCTDEGREALRSDAVAAHGRHVIDMEGDEE